MLFPARSALLGGSAIVGIGLAVELGSQFARTLILARLLGSTEFGIVASIMTLVSLVETVSFVGIDRFIIYSPEGDEALKLEAVHALAWLRGIISAVAIGALAYPTAMLVGAPAYAGSFAAVAAVPLLRGANHLGTIQMQRSGVFLPSAAVESGAALLGLVVTAAAALIFPDHRDIVVALVVQAAASLLLSQLLARGVPYRIAFTGARMREALRFGLPLIINGLALAVAYQLDRMVVGAWLGVVAVGIYGLAMTLLLQPISLIGRLATTALQPRMSAAWHGSRMVAFPSQVRDLSRSVAAAGAAGATVVACLGAPVVRLMFGSSYSASDPFFALIAAVALVRFIRAGQSVLGLAIGRTSDLMLSNVAGAVALPVTVVAFYFHAGLESAVFGILVAELLSVTIAYARLKHHCGRIDPATLGILAGAASLPAVLSAWVLLNSPSLWPRIMATGFGVAAVGCLVLFAPRLKRLHQGVAR